jgi:hypothetical protein
MVAAMLVLAAGAAAEVAQHVLYNWLYLGLIPSFYLATFYSGLALGKNMLALAVSDGPPGCWHYMLALASVASFVAIAQREQHVPTLVSELTTPMRIMEIAVTPLFRTSRRLPLSVLLPSSSF